jgi:hypothetical protein
MQEPKKTRRGRKRADETFLAAFACGATVEKAAEKAGFSKSTASRRLQDQDFQKRLAEVKAETVRRASAMLNASGLEAIKTLLELLNPSYPPAVRLGAARSIIELGVRLREIVELEGRIAALEGKEQVKEKA